MSDFFHSGCHDNSILKRPVVSEGVTNSGSLSGSSNGSSKTLCSCPSSIPNNDSLAEEAESVFPEPES